jgi:carboxymethylenebutenolidase
MVFGPIRTASAVTALSALLFAAIFSTVFGTGIAYGQTGDDDNNQTETQRSILRGQVASVQMSEDGDPEWIQSGIWVMRISPTDDPDAPNVNLISRMAMVMVNGSAMHRHSIYDFELDSRVVNGTNHTYEGTATVTMREGPVTGVPLVVEIINNSVVAMTIGPDEIDSHFGTGPVYGTLSEASQNAARGETGSSTGGQMPRNNATSTEPSPDPDATPAADNNTSVELEGLTRESVQYHSNATGYLVYPENSTGTLPGVVMVHEWWGLNQNIKNMAETLASEGYVVLAADMYGGEVATESSRAGQLAGSVRNNTEEAMANLNSAVAHLSSLSNVDSSRIATLGWCFGGSQTMQHALNTQQPLAATVIYYGNLVTDQQEVAKITWPVLGVFGAEDQSIPVATVDQFKAALDANNISNEVYVYDGVGHAFANPSGDNYAPEETEDAWNKTVSFLERHVKTTTA